MSKLERRILSGAGCKLSVSLSGPEDGPVLLMVHGMRDHAGSMRLMADRFPEYRIVTPDLRGHGDSDNPGVYGLLQFVSDVVAVVDQLALTGITLVGHSLGGHITARYSSLYPDKVKRLVLLDGLGPPGIAEHEDSDARRFRSEQWRRAVALQLSAPVQRPMTSVMEAAEKLARNNPGLPAARALSLAEAGVQREGSGFVWKWDARVDSIWTTFSHAESEAGFADITSPVLLVTGEHAFQYWAQRREHLQGREDLYRSDLVRRERLFSDARSLVIPDAGHMLHYDQPVRVGEAIRAFIAG